MTLNLNEEDVLFPFRDFYNALTGAAARGVLKQHPELLTDQAIAVLIQVRDRTDDPFTRAAIDTVCTALKRYNEHWSSVQKELGPDVMPSVLAADVHGAQTALTRFASDHDLRALDEAVQAWERVLNNLAFAESSLGFKLAIWNNVANTYRQRNEIAPSPKDLETAVALAEQAVHSLPRNAPDRADHINFLSGILVERYRRSLRLDDLERSIQIAKDLLDSPPPDPRDLSDTWNGLGHSLMERYERTLVATDLEQAIHSYEHAAEETRPEAPNFPIIFNNLGEACRQMFLLTRSREHLDSAIRVCERALAASEHDNALALRAMTNLANVLLDRYDLLKEEVWQWGGGPRQDLARAVELLMGAKERTAPRSFERAVILNSLLSVPASAQPPAQNASEFDEDLRTMEEAIAGVPSLSPEVLPFLYNAGTLLSRRYRATKAPADLQASIEYWDRACSLLRGLFSGAPVEYKLGQQHKWTELHRQLVLAFLEQAQVDAANATTATRRAMVITEAWKARVVTELVGRGHLAAPLAIANEAVRERQLLAELTALDNTELASGLGRPLESSGLERVRRRTLCLEELRSLWESMAAKGPEAAQYVSVRRADELDWEQLLALAADTGPKTVLVSHLIAGSRTLLFILRAGWAAPQVVGLDVDEVRGSKMLDQLFQQIYCEPEDAASASHTWDETIRPLLEKAVSHVTGAARAVFVPVGSGYLIPWAVLAEHAGWRLADGRPMPVIIVPALAVLARLRQRSKSTAGRPLIVGDPRENMVYAEDEAREIASLVNARPLIGRRANKSTVRRRLAKAALAHFAAHAFFRPGAPLDSGIQLADEDLTAQELMTGTISADLIVLSACETGRAGSLGGDEVAGLAMALMQAGARTLVVSLWPVSGLATATLMSAFYALLLERGDAAAALSEAMMTTRTAWTHPHYWGSFAIYGDWSPAVRRRRPAPEAVRTRNVS